MRVRNLSSDTMPGGCRKSRIPIWIEPLTIQSFKNLNLLLQYGTEQSTLNEQKGESAWEDIIC